MYSVEEEIVVSEKKEFAQTIFRVRSEGTLVLQVSTAGIGITDVYANHSKFATADIVTKAKNNIRQYVLDCISDSHTNWAAVEHAARQMIRLGKIKTFVKSDAWTWRTVNNVGDEP